MVAPPSLASDECVELMSGWTSTSQSLLYWLRDMVRRNKARRVTRRSSMAGASGVRHYEAFWRGLLALQLVSALHTDSLTCMGYGDYAFLGKYTVHPKAAAIIWEMLITKGCSTSPLGNPCYLRSSRGYHDYTVPVPVSSPTQR